MNVVDTRVAAVVATLEVVGDTSIMTVAGAGLACL